MQGFTVERDVAASPATVFAVASDLRRAAEHMRGIVRVEVLTDGPIGAGTRFRETRRIMKREATEEMVVTGFDPPHGYELECVSHGCRFRTAFRFLPSGEGTRVAVAFQVEPLGRVARLLGFLMRPMLSGCERELGRDLDDLRAAAEALAREGGARSERGVGAGRSRS